MALAIHAASRRYNDWFERLEGGCVSRRIRLTVMEIEVAREGLQLPMSIIKNEHDGPSSMVASSLMRAM